MTDRPTFEQTYPRYEFSNLVRLGLLVAGWLGGPRRARGDGRGTATATA